MTARRLFVVTAAVVLGGAAAVLPAAAVSETTPAIEAQNLGGGIYGEQHRWAPSEASVAVGGSVALSNPTAVAHGVRWVAGPGVPACTASVPVGTSAAASGTDWSGSCTFSKPGVYTFYCTVHGAAMAGTVVVGAGTPPATTGTPTTPTSTQAEPPASPTGSTVPPVTGPGAAAGSSSPFAGPHPLALASGPHGSIVRGSVDVSAAGAGGRLAVNVLVPRAAFAATRGTTPLVVVGRFTRASLPAGRVPFAVRLDGRATHALRLHGRLAARMRVSLTSAGAGTPVVLSRSFVLRR